MSPNEIADVAVIGGGIAGAGVARDAAMRGLRVKWFERHTLGSATSGKSSKLIHGGVRYLELAANHFIGCRFREALKDFRFVFTSLRESRTLERLAPDLVRPVPLAIPLYRKASPGPLRIRLGVWAYFVLARLSGPARVPRFVPASEADSVLPGIRRDGLKGLVILWDRTVDDAGLVRRVAASALSHGAQLHENCEVTAYAKEGGAYRLRFLSNEVAGDCLVRMVVNASGPWIDRVRARGGAPSDALVDPVGGSHIELGPVLPHSAILRGPDGRVVFALARGARVRVGTTERRGADPEESRPPASDIDYLLEAVTSYFPSLDLSRMSVLSSDCAVRPLAKSGAGAPSGISREHELHEDKDGTLHLVGVKLTDHRRAAEKTVDALAAKLGSTACCRTAREAF